MQIPVNISASTLCMTVCTLYRLIMCVLVKASVNMRVRIVCYLHWGFRKKKDTKQMTPPSALHMLMEQTGEEKMLSCFVPVKVSPGAGVIFSPIIKVPLSPSPHAQPLAWLSSCLYCTWTSVAQHYRLWLHPAHPDRFSTKKVQIEACWDS